MLDEKDLQMISQLMDQKLQVFGQEMDQKMDQKLADTESRIMKNVAALMDAEFTPKFNLLAEGQQAILEKMVPRSRVDDLEDEMKFLKVMVRQMAERISDLEKAN